MLSLPAMPTVESGAKVLVSGANGFIAVWVIRALLEAGFSVRGTVRAQEKGVHPKKLFELYKERFEIVLVRDNTEVRVDHESPALYEQAG